MRASAALAPALMVAGCATAGGGSDGYLLVTNEPFRSVEVAGVQAVYRGVEIGGGGRAYRVVADETRADGGRAWRAERGGSTLAFAITPGGCEDDMSAQRYPYRATVTIDGSASTGCARRLSDPVPPVPGE